MNLQRFGLWLLILGVALSSCIAVEFRRPRVEPVDTVAPPVDVESPLRAHLLDGSILVFREGARFQGGFVLGEGERYAVDASFVGRVSEISLDSVAAMETYTTEIREPQSVAATLGASAVLMGGSVLLFKAIFGSCPTTYADSAGVPVLQAESFSNSVAPLLEMRDVDRLRVHPDAAGAIRLDVRNEALETHYINHLELVEVAHAADEIAVPAPFGQAYGLRDAVASVSASDRAGRDVRADVQAEDEHVYQTDASVLAAVDEADPTDWIELTFPRPAADSAAVLLRLRNSLFSTVYFYEFMLAQQGARSLDWIHTGLANVSTAVEMGDYYLRRMGLHVEVWDGQTWREAGRITEVGPIAWSEVAVAFPTPPGPEVRIRLRFVADAWRIDRVALADARVRPTRAVPLDHVEGAPGIGDTEAAERLTRADRAYVVTYPGERFTAVFEPGPSAAPARSFFLAAQGYYIEWMRSDWLREGVAGEPFHADDATLVAALRRWQRVKPDYEAQFEQTRLPVQ